MTGRKKWRWIEPNAVFAIHDWQIAEHGGLDGIRDAGAIESALNKPKNLALYEKPDVPDLAAAYAFGLVRNHGFYDGNKRTAWVVARLFLADNGYRLNFDPIEAVRLVETLAAGKMDEDQFADWFRQRLSKGIS